MTFKCLECEKVFTRKFNRDKHFKKQHTNKEHSVKEKKIVCPFCRQKDIKKEFQNKELLVKHVDKEHLDSLKYKLRKSAFDGKLSFF